MSTNLSVIIPMYNENLNILNTLDSIVSQEMIENIEIIIIDDNSSDNSYELVNQFILDHKLQIKLIKNNINKGPSYSIHIGIMNAIGKLILIIGADSILSEKYFSRVFSLFQDEHIIAIGSKNRTLSNDYFGIIGQDLNDIISDNIFINGSGMAFRRNILKELNVFDGKTYWCEDLDFNIQVSNYIKKNLKYSIVVDNMLIIYTRYPNNSKSIIKRHYLWGVGRAYLSRKYGLLSIPGNRSKLLFISLILISPSLIIISFLLHLSMTLTFISMTIPFIIILTPSVIILAKLTSIEDKNLLKKYMINLPGIIYISYLHLVGGVVGFIFGYIKNKFSNN